MSRRVNAFTLIETLVTVVIIGVLAMLAVVAYRRWIQSSYMSEANDMVSNIRTAEEAFRAENGGYLTISAGLGPPNDYPAATPGSFKTGWGGACSTCVNSWAALTVQPNAPVFFGYSLIADNGGTNNPPSPGGVDLSRMTGQPWYVIEADGDLDRDGDSTFTQVIGASGTNQLMVVNEGH